MKSKITYFQNMYATNQNYKSDKNNEMVKIQPFFFWQTYVTQLAYVTSMIKIYKQTS